VRVPDEVLSFVEEFSENFALSRQEVLLTLLEAGISEAKVQLEIKQDQAESGNFHILNTNKGNNDDDQSMMLAGGIAAAFYDPWKFNINRIKSSDWVFLYENQKGIIAYGQGTGETLVKDHEGNPDQCHYQKLKNFTVLVDAMPAKEIKKILGRHQIFLRTMSAMPGGEGVLETLKNREKK
jgi:hypothetical protein